MCAQELLQLPHVDVTLLKELASRKNKNEKVCACVGVVCA
jgi:hypothetical protein